MFRTMVLSAAGAALVVCLVVTVLQFVTTVPMILYAEQFEGTAAETQHDGSPAAAAADSNDAEAWTPAEGLERAAYTGLVLFFIDAFDNPYAGFGGVRPVSFELLYNDHLHKLVAGAAPPAG